MYRISKFKLIKRAGINGVLVVAAMTGGVALSSALLHHAATPATSAATTAPTASGANPSSATSSATSRVSPSTVTQLSPRFITVTSAAGVATTYSLDPSTVVMVGKTRATTAQLALGERVFVVASPTNATTAATIGVLPGARGEDGGGDGAVATAVSYGSDN